MLAQVLQHRQYGTTGISDGNEIRKRCIVAQADLEGQLPSLHLSMYSQLRPPNHAARFLVVPVVNSPGLALRDR